MTVNGLIGDVVDLAIEVDVVCCQEFFLPNEKWVSP